MTTTNPSEDLDAIAIIGMSCRLPGAPDVQTYWRNLLAEVESISFPSDAQLLQSGVDADLLADPAFVKAGGLLTSIENFDAAFFGFSPREASLMEPQHRLFLECAWEAMEHAGYTGQSHDGSIGVFGGAAMNAYLLLNLATRPDLAPALFDFQIQIGNDKDYLTTRVSYKLNLNGPSLNVQTACSTSLVAVHVACQSLLNGECNLALAGGVAISLPQQVGHRYQAGGIHSDDGHCRAFDAAATGTVFGSGAGVVVLKRLADALADGDHVHALIRGSAVNNDGNAKVGFTAPSVDGQAAAITEALAVARVTADTIGFVECHGTGTAVGDPIEVQALTQAFRQTSQRTGYCTIGSVKSNIGHLDVASGVAGLIKATLALAHGQIPATLHYRTPNPEIDFANSPFRVNAALSDWPPGLRRAGVSSFGLGGTNAHVVLEQAPAPLPPDTCRPHALVLLSAKTPTALAQMAERLATHLEGHPEDALADVAFTLQTGREAFAQRRSWVAADRQGLIEALRRPDRQAPCSAGPGRVVFMFPGQGAQHVDMARDIHAHEPLFREPLDRCAEVLHDKLGLDLRTLLFPAESQREDAARQLQQTWITQPALFAVEYSLARLWMGWGIQPQVLIGHSIGEYVAACLAGVMTLADALTLVAARGRLMQDLPGGAMLAVDLAEGDLGDLAAQGLDLAAVNAASRCVLSGTTESVDAFEARMLADGKRCRRLLTSHAFHSAMMDPVLDRFTALVATVDLRPPRIPMISNLTGTWLTPEQATDPAYYALHLRHTVRFSAGLALASQPPGSILLEVGPGRSLAATLGPQAVQTTGQAAAPIVLGTLRHPQQPEADTAVLMGTLGRLWCAGQPVNWTAVHAPLRRRRLALPTYPFERQRHWIEPGRAAGSASGVAGAAVRQATRPAGVVKQPIGESFYRPAWQRADLPSGRGPSRSEGPWLVFADASSQGAALVRQLERMGQRVLTLLPRGPGDVVAEPGITGLRIQGPLREDYDQMIDMLQEGGIWPPRNILHAWNLAPAGPGGLAPAEFDQAQDLGLNSLLMLAQAMAARQLVSPMTITVLGSGLHALALDDPLYPERAPLVAACTVLSQEFPQFDCRCIDVRWPPSDHDAAGLLISQVLDEINSDAPDRVLAFRDGARWVCSYPALRLSAATGIPRRLRWQGVYLITGGLGSIGGALAEYLARTVKARLVLTGRSTMPPRDSWAGWLASHAAENPTSQRIGRLMALEALGAEVLVLAADVADIEQMGSVLTQAEGRFGRIDGVIHGAGIVADDAFLSVQDCSRANNDLHFRPKVQGLRVLQTLLESRSPDFVMLLSSISSVLGGLGYTAYAAANRVLDAQAQLNARDAPGHWISVNWDAWQPEFDQAKPRGMGSIVASLALSTAEGVEAFARILDQDDLLQVIVSATDLPTRVAQWAQRRSSDEAPLASPSPSSKSAADLPTATTPAIEQHFDTEMQATLASIWCQVLGIDRVEPNDNFFDVGGDSLLLMDVIARLQSGLGLTLNPRETMFQTLAQIAALCDQKRAMPGITSVEPAAVPAPRKAGLIDSLKMKVLGSRRVVN